MERHIITLEDVKWANACLMGQAEETFLSNEDRRLFEYVRRTLPAIKDISELRKIWKAAQEEEND